MATENGPDLSAGQQAVEALMDDTCTVRDFVDPSLWVTDPETLRLTVPPGTPVVYDGGKCKFKPLGVSLGGRATEGGQQLAVDQFKLDVPLGSPVFVEGQAVTVDSSRRMPAAVGETFVVKGPLPRTMAVQQSFVVERRKRVE